MLSDPIVMGLTPIDRNHQLLVSCALNKLSDASHPFQAAREWSSGAWLKSGRLQYNIHSEPEPGNPYGDSLLPQSRSSGIAVTRRRPGHCWATSSIRFHGRTSRV
jgi:hypothetical protein